MRGRGDEEEAEEEGEEEGGVNWGLMMEGGRPVTPLRFGKEPG